MIAIFITLTNTSVAVCPTHRHLAEHNGWSYLEDGLYDEKEDWPCYFAQVDTFWHTSNGQIFTSRGMSVDLQAEATTMERYRQIVKRAYGSLRGIKFGMEAPKAKQDHNSCSCCEGTGHLDHGISLALGLDNGPTCPTYKGTGERRTA